ncbi:DNA alkylation repair protein [Mesobacillus campisalis]|uniref:DNA alkylation repair protein n=1 Tax=Mesobacillus campisalis TaxID=1408103 RepID=A0A0M2SWE1_9BACI|nr:DNA alkylation repair protein [Mesobacillus campisalis]KKK38031.1 DNA alkylation repair protein [Mesobacillus campisalis]
MKKLAEQLRSMMAEKANKENAVHMKAYMKGKFPFFGIKTPQRREIEKQFFTETGILKQPFSEEFVLSLWDFPERELQAAAMDYIEKFLKQLTKEHFYLMKKLITSKSWWDTVDMLAQKPVGKIAADHPELIQEEIEHWAVASDMWLRRSAIIFQLKYKERTNEELLYRYITLNADSKEFFIQKGIGWALREYSKTNPESVKSFISSHRLAPLSVREGSRHLPARLFPGE